MLLAWNWLFLTNDVSLCCQSKDSTIKRPIVHHQQETLHLSRGWKLSIVWKQCVQPLALTHCGGCSTYIRSHCKHLQPIPYSYQTRRFVVIPHRRTFNCVFSKFDRVSLKTSLHVQVIPWHFIHNFDFLEDLIHWELVNPVSVFFLPQGPLHCFRSGFRGVLPGFCHCLELTAVAPGGIGLGQGLGGT